MNRTFKELTIIFIGAVCLFAFAIITDLFEDVLRWFGEMEAYQLDEVIIIFLYLALAFLIFAFRRNRELINEIAERERAEEALREREERYRSLVNNIPDVVWSSNSRGETPYISPAVEKVYGYTPKEIAEGGESLWFGRIHPDDIDGVKKAYEALITTAEKFDIEYRIRRKDGEWIWLHDRALTVYEKNNVFYVDGIFADVTERKQMEAERERLLKETDRINKELNDFAYIVSHDLKAPLRGITQLAQWISEDYSDKFDENGNRGGNYGKAYQNIELGGRRS